MDSLSLRKNNVSENMNVDSLLRQYFPASVVDHRTDPAGEFDDLFLEDDPQLDKLW